MFSLSQTLKRKPSSKPEIQINNKEIWYEVKGPKTVLVANRDGFQPVLEGRCFVRKGVKHSGLKRRKHCYRSNEQQDFTEDKRLAGFQEMLAGQDHLEVAGYIFED